MTLDDIKERVQFRLKGQMAVFLAAVFVFVLGTFVALVATETFSRELEYNLNNRVQISSDNIKGVISRRAAAYELILVNSSNIFRLDDRLSRGEWHDFIASMNIPDRYPGTLGIGYSKILKNNQLEAHINEQREEYISYDVWPEGIRSEYAAVTFISPPHQLNKTALGYDMYSSGLRRKAMTKARDSGIVTVTEPVSLVNDMHVQSQPGMIIFNAVYSGPSPSSVSERKNQIQGYSYAVVRAGALIRGLFGETYQSGNVSFKIYDTSEDTQVLYTSPNYSVLTDSSHVRRVNYVPFFDKDLRVDVVAVSSEIFFTPFRVFTTGLIISLSIALIVYSLITRRLKHLRQRHHKAVEKSKSELLALASHQLRTPATGVKQYVGMILQGYSGKITDEQRSLLEKAYKSNENQLDIINELLYVAKAEANQLYIDTEEVNVTEVVKESVERSLLHAKKKDIKLDFRTKKKITAEIDPRYIGMAVNNLISNAIKYSHAGGKVTINVGESIGNVRINIKDSGVGIKPHQMSELFKKFSRIPNEYSQQEGGSGLGLFLAKRIAKAHGGNLTAKSRPGVTTVFTLDLPKVFKPFKKRNISNRFATKRKVDLRDEGKK